MGEHADDFLNDIVGGPYWSPWDDPNDRTVLRDRESLILEHDTINPNLLFKRAETHMPASVTQQSAKKKKGAPPPSNVRRPSPTKQAAAKGELPNFIIFEYGPPGVGKTSKWAHLPDVGFIHDSQEPGIRRLLKFGRCPEPVMIETADTFDHTMDLLSDVANRKWDIKSLVLDSCTGFEKYCFQKHCEEDYGGDWGKQGFMAYTQGPKSAAKHLWPEFLQQLQDLANDGLNIVLLAHSEVKSFKNPTGADYDQFRPVLEESIWQATHRWAEAVLFYDIHVETGKDKGETRTKAKSSRRIIGTEPEGAYKAKNPWGLPGIINAGESSEEAYDNFMSAYRKAASRG